jgi:hypothetical protein
MGIANKAISTNLLNIIIRTNHVQTEICNSETLIKSFNMTMQDVTWLVFVKTF